MYAGLGEMIADVLKIMTEARKFHCLRELYYLYWMTAVCKGVESQSLKPCSVFIAHCQICETL